MKSTIIQTNQYKKIADLAHSDMSPNSTQVKDTMLLVSLASLAVG